MGHDGFGVVFSSILVCLRWVDIPLVYVFMLLFMSLVRFNLVKGFGRSLNFDMMCCCTCTVSVTVGPAGASSRSPLVLTW